jgi:hypothetical protein
MKLDVPFLQLPLAFDAAALAAEIEALGPDAWRPHPQGFPGNDALALVSVNGDPESDAVRGPMRPTPQLLACPYLMQAMHALGAVWGRSRLMRLSGQAEVTPHVDTNYYWREHMRVHVPIVTQPTVRFHCGDSVINMRAGECWIFDTWRLHKVLNDDSRARIHLVADTVGGRGFWGHMRHARPHDRREPAWQPRTVRPEPGKTVELDYESVNLPTVMSPWEARDHLGFLIGETPPGEGARAFAQQLVGPFLRDWQAVWAQHGDAGGGLDEYRQLREMLRAALSNFEGIPMRNGIMLVNAVRAIVVTNLVADGVGGDVEVRENPAMAAARKAAQATTAAPPAAVAADAAIEEPILVLSSPRSGSTLLFETLAQAPGLYTTGGEGHGTFETLEPLHPARHGWASNRLVAADATPPVVAALRRNFARELRDRDGAPPPPGARVRLLEKTPKNALRVPFLRATFPDARYVYLFRDPRPTLASMIEAWQSGRFRTYPDLPGWEGPAWSLLLVPGWRDWQGRPLEEIVARQWAATTDQVLADLEAVPRERVACIRYEQFIAAPQAQVERLAAELGLGWDRTLASLPNARHTVTPPDPDKWRKHEAAIERVFPLVEAALARAERFLAAG